MKILSQEFQLQRSYWLGMIFFFIHLGAIVCVFFMAFIVWGKIAIVICILGDLIIVVRAHVLRSGSQAIIGFWQNDNREWYVRKRSGEIELVFLDFPVFVSNYFMVLNFVATKNDEIGLGYTLRLSNVCFVALSAMLIYQKYLVIIR
jgi:hypothetical protein